MLEHTILDFQASGRWENFNGKKSQSYIFKILFSLKVTIATLSVIVLPNWIYYLDLQN